MRAIRLVMTSLVLVVCLTACGQKGDLYLPDKKAHAQSMAPSAASGDNLPPSTPR